MKIIHIIALTAITFLAGCETTADGIKRLTPEAKQILTDTGHVVLDAAINAGMSYAGQAINGQVDQKQVAAAAISGAANGLRTLPASSPTTSQLNDALVTFSGDPKLAAQLAPAVTGAVQTSISQGVPPGAAIENAAKQLDTAAATVAK